MGLAWFLVYWKWKALRTGEGEVQPGGAVLGEDFRAEFWDRSGDGHSHGVSVWNQLGGFLTVCRWSDWADAGHGRHVRVLSGERAFIGSVYLGEKTAGPARWHFLAAVAVALGSWLSGYFILVTNAFMQHPEGSEVADIGSLGIASIGAILCNPWSLLLFTHNQAAAVVTGAFVVAAVGSLFTLCGACI